MSYAVIESHGLSNIADGREFVVTEPAQRYKLPTEDNKIFLTTPVDHVEPVAEGCPFSCSCCGGLYERSVVGHNAGWMYSVFSCMDHPTEDVLLDVFPKLTLELTQDWYNAFMGLDTRTPAEQAVAAGVIEGYQAEEDWVQVYKKQAKAHYLMTPEGINRQHRIWVPGWLDRLRRNTES